eukprot:jgi/Mesvir1/14779/Mv05420-RA.2
MPANIGLRLVSSCLLVMSLACHAGIAHAATYPALYTYGDSFVDCNGVLGTWKAYGGPASPPNARVSSNGPTWSYYLAKSMGLDCPYSNFNTDAGVVCNVWRDYATGGACSRNWTGLIDSTDFGACQNPHPYQIFNPYQVQTHISYAANTTLNRDGLHIISIGSNDILLPGSENLTLAAAYMATARAAIGQGVRDLYNSGARHFYLINMEALTLNPGFRTSLDDTFRAQVDESLQQYVVAFHNDLVQLRASLPDAHITEINLLGCMYEMNANCTFRALGFTDWKDACMEDSGNPSAPKCSRPDKYIWWDPYHHTTAFHSVLGSLLKDVMDGKSNACLQTACLGDTISPACPGGLDECPAAAPPVGTMPMWGMFGRCPCGR